MAETIERLAADRVDWIGREFSGHVWAKAEGYFERCFEAQQRGELVVLVSWDGEKLLGYLKVVWRPAYPPFLDQGIPEIRDLNVVPDSRRQGVATRLMDRAERLVAERRDRIGIGVGLHPGYGPAQRMCVLRRYVPDARALTYDDEFVEEGQPVKLDDSLIMHLTKGL